MTTGPAQHLYDPDWPRRAAELCAAWHALPGCVAAHHIGSTAVPGLGAKPVLDLLPVFDSLDALESARPKIEALGYDWKGAYGLPGRRYCRIKLADRHLVHAHAYAIGDAAIHRHLAFRDALRADPGLRDAYRAIKARCAARFPQDMEGYMDCKDAFIKREEARALTRFPEERLP